MQYLMTLQVKIDECNCLIILKGGVRSEYTVGKGEVIAIDPKNITLNKGAEVREKEGGPTGFDPS